MPLEERTNIVALMAEHSNEVGLIPYLEFKSCSIF